MAEEVSRYECVKLTFTEYYILKSMCGTNPSQFAAEHQHVKGQQEANKQE